MHHPLRWQPSLHVLYDKAIQENKISEALMYHPLSWQNKFTCAIDRYTTIYYATVGKVTPTVLIKRWTYSDIEHPIYRVE